ncbi:MAG: glycosyltransferase [Candidatus Pacebacteria bacterium]|nr:glycosyltransferase [Candidatus Paceibacterota bacterium]
MAKIKNKTAFFIVTPSYNQAQFIEETIGSVLNQKGDFDIHYFVADGGSSDGTKKILSEFSSKLTFVSEKDRGQTDAINKGIKHFKKLEKKYDNTYFAYINSDDYYLPGAFQAVVKNFKENAERMWLVGDTKIIDEKGGEIQEPVRLYKKLWRTLFFLNLLYILNPIPQPATFLRWQAVEKIGKFDESLSYTMDYQYWLRAIQKVGKPLFIPDTLAAFRIHGSSKGGSLFLNQFKEQYQTAKNLTTNRLLLSLHLCHNFITISVYKLLKAS